MNKKKLQKENERLQKLVELLQEEKKSLEYVIMLQRAIHNPFIPWTNCYNDMMVKARIAQYGYIPNPDPWRNLNG